MEIKDPKLAEQVSEIISKRKGDRMERRFVEAEVRAEHLGGKDNYRIVGYAAVFNQKTQLYRGFYEQVAPGAFANTIKGDDVRALINHDPNLLLGRTKAGTVTLSEDEHGLRYEIIPPDTTYANDLRVSLKRGDISQSSFGFNIVDFDEKRDVKTGEVTVTLKEVKLFDVSPVTYPAYQGTEAHVRMIEGEKERAYVYEGSGHVIVQDLEAKPKTPAQSDEEYFRQIDELAERLK